MAENLRRASRLVILVTRATGRRRVGVYIAQTVQLAQCSDKASGTNGVVKNLNPATGGRKTNTVHGTIYTQRVGERRETQLRDERSGAMRIDG